MRTGGTAALTYGQAITGVASAALCTQRRAVARAVAPPTGFSGQDLDLALILADEAPSGRTDPAFEAHIAPVVTWAKGHLGTVATQCHA